MESIFWRDKGAVRYVAAIDTIMAIFLLGFYLIGGVMLNTIIVDIQNGPASKFTLFLASTAVWILVFFITFNQMRSSYNLFIVTYQDALGPQVTIKKAQTWMRISFVVLGFILVKIVYLSTGQFNVMPFIWVICGIEIFIQVLGLYFVRESIDDLKQELFVLRKATAPSTKSPFPEKKYPVPEMKSRVPENKSLVPENKSLVLENQSLEPENQSLVPENQSLVPENQSLIPENQSLIIPENNSILKDTPMEAEEV